MANFLDHQGNDSGFTKEQWCEALHPLIKAECEKRILIIMPEWKQSNTIADLWSDDEAVEAAGNEKVKKSDFQARHGGSASG